MPWRITRHTNILEMQATCPRCNQRKGGKAVTAGFEGFRPERLRVGQQGAVRTIIERIREGQTHTPIVLPTRYGKSDVIRVAGAMLIKNRVTSRCLVMEPATYLVNQIMSPSAMAEAIVNYGLPFEAKDLSVYPMLHAFRFESLVADYAPFLAMTTQMAMVNTKNGVLQHVVDYDISKGYGRPIVFIDEAHTGSKANAWGESTRALAEAGAYLVLLTATPFRTDEEAVYGFAYKPVQMDPITRYQPDGEYVHKYEGYEIAHKLDTDTGFEYTFDQAWAEEPLPICVLSHRTFDVKMAELEGDESGDLLGTRMLSELPESEARRWIGKVVRNPVTVQRGVETFLDVLMDLRKDAPKSKGIVFVGNTAGEDFGNENALRVKAAIENGTRLRADIATDAIDGGTVAAQARIDAFATGRGADVLIVKQMGGVGLDVPALKVALDLSPVRTPTASIQRMMRIGTIWPEPEPGHKPMYIAHWVTPADAMSIKLFNVTVHEKGGDAKTIDVEYVESFLRNPKPPPPKRAYIPLEGQEGDTLADTEGNTAPSTKIPWIKHVKDRVKRISYVLSDPQIANLQDLAKDYEDGQQSEADEPAPVGEVINIPAVKRRLQASINWNIGQVVYVLHPGAKGEAYSEPFRKYMTELKTKRCKLPYKELQDYSIRDLERLLKEAEAWLAEVRSR